MIDIGGEDAKIVLFEQGKAKDLRMNGNCAGGTGAFIDQMAVLLDVDVSALDALACEATQTYAIASRCGVFCKTDIQNLIAKNAAKSDIAASIFRAVTVQTVSTLAHGCELWAPMMLVGGPLTFIPSLRKSFVDLRLGGAGGRPQAHLSRFLFPSLITMRGAPRPTAVPCALRRGSTMANRRYI